MLLKVNESSIDETFVLEYNDTSYVLSTQEIDNAFYVTARLIDSCYEGPAMVELGGETVVMDQSDWEKLYDVTEQRLQDIFEDFEEEVRVIH